MKIHVEVKRDANQLPTEVSIKKGRRKAVKISYIYTPTPELFGFTLEGKRDALPSFAEILEIVDARRLDRIGTIDIVDVIKLINEIAVIKSIETIGSMPDFTPRGSEGVAFRQMPAGAGAWVSPTGYTDPDGGWSSEANAYDDDTGTKAREDFIAPFSWSSFIYLTRAATTCNKIRVYAEKYHQTVDKIDVDVFRNGAWVHVYQGSFADQTWIEYPFSEGSITQARIRFYSSSSGWNYAYLNDVDFWEVPTSGGELVAYVFAYINAWDGSTYREVRCDSDGYLLTKAAP